MYTIKNSNFPNILTHKDTFIFNKFYASARYIINSNLNYFFNKCPHRGNRIIEPGSVKNKFQCDLHGWQWDENGIPLNNSVNLVKKTVTKGQSGLIFLNWNEPQDAKWVNDLQIDNFIYGYNIIKQGLGDWRWQMEMHVDLLHVPYIHDSLNKYIDVYTLKTDRGDDWICQYHDHGWWLFVYPYTHIEYEPGCLYISEISPNNEKGYDVYIHYLFNPLIDAKVKSNFIKMAEITFDEDIKAVDNLSQNNVYKKPHKNLHVLEKDILHFYNWLDKNTN